jgi:hypothetical protein
VLILAGWVLTSLAEPTTVSGMTLSREAPTTLTLPATRTGYGSLRDLSRYQWFVFAVAAIAWMADCMDQQLFSPGRRASRTYSGATPRTRM